VIFDNSLLLIILIAQVVSGLCLSLYGNILHLRKTPLLADALSHSVLPGLVMAFLWTGSRSVSVMILGGLVSTWLAVTLMRSLEEKKYFRKDVAIVVTYTSFFALGVFLLSMFMDSIDLDPDCVLFGDLTFLPFAKGHMIWGYEWPRPFINILAMTFLSALFFLIYGRTLAWQSFDRLHFVTQKSRFQSWGPVLFRVLLSATLIVHFEILGSINVLTSLLIPPVLSALTWNTPKSFIWGSLLWSVVIQGLGFVLSLKMNALFSVGPGIVGGILLLAFVGVRLNSNN
jgi:manganese/zinc/iron transport system permease protein